MDVVVQQDALDIAVADCVLATCVAADEHDGLRGTGAERKFRDEVQSDHGIGLGTGLGVEVVQGLRKLRNTRMKNGEYKLMTVAFKYQYFTGASSGISAFTDSRLWRKRS